MIIVADTSALHAAFDAAQPEHSAAATVLDSQPLVISPFVMTELDHLIRRDLGFSAAMQASEALLDRMAAGQYKLAELRHADVVKAHEVRGKYDGLRLDLAVAAGVVVADRYNTNQIFTLDRRAVRAVRPLTSRFKAFEILPFDG
ncbi:PIN domain-containing protein [Saccharomonospora xinjiangensis]|uniref:PIN domain-containing protein n=1 Tax=Saccharomonospora xinjiangensis TaxID=75294 RepID=UPI00106F7961|nr:PIN domain-containing protein [Saccharomonospora xinjiangensis]QBQ62195.1 Ribonuclease VapC26 [Saccharomonospora xinjiangensis]